MLVLDWLMITYETIVLNFLVWRARRKLRALGKASWADAIKVCVDEDDWEKKDG